MDSEQITVNSSDREYKKKRVEELGSALAQIRARVKANRGTTAKKDEERSGTEESGAGGGEVAVTERTAKTKKILEEDRVRFTKHQQDRAKMKDAIDQILIEREEQKKVEKQLQEKMAKVTAPAPEVPPLIQQRILDLETTVETLKERLGEKDKVLSSKSQALTLLHNQLMQRSHEHAERAMAISQEIATMKEDFEKREDSWKKELARLKDREEELEKRLSEKESEAENVEELQSKLQDAEKKIEEMTKNLHSLNKVNLKLKAQLKALKIEREQFKKDQEGLANVEELQNRIALLEEEKVSHENIQKKVVALEEELAEAKNTQVLFSEEKKSAENLLEIEQKKVSEQESLIKELSGNLKTMEEKKIYAEIKSVELEEKLDVELGKIEMQNKQLSAQIEELRSEINEKDSLVESLRSQLSVKEQEIFDIKGNNNFPEEMEADMRLREIESYNSELVEKVRELQLKCEGHEATATALQDSLREKNEIIAELKGRTEELSRAVSDLEADRHRLEEEMARLRSRGEGEKQEMKEDQSKLVQKFKKLAASYKLKCQDLQERLDSSGKELEEKIRCISELISQRDELTAQRDESVMKNEELLAVINELTPKMEAVEAPSYKLKCEDLQEKLELKCKELEEKINYISELISQKDELSTQLEVNVKKNEKLLAIINELTPKMEAMEAERSSTLLNVEKMNKEFEELKEWKEGDSKLLREHVTNVNSMAAHVLQLESELGTLQGLVGEKNSVIGELEAERKKLVDDIQNSESELERLRALYQQESVKNQSVLSNLQGLESEMLVSREEMNQIADQLDAVTRNYNVCLGNLQERENYIEVLEQDIVGMKSKMYSLESGIEDRHRMLEERGNQLATRLEEAEIMRQTYDKYQAEMEKKLKLMEENESLLKQHFQGVEAELNELRRTSQELLKEKETREGQMAEMNQELESLRELRNSYNTTLDRIEELNGEFTQVTQEFEAKNAEMIKVAEERADLFNRLTDLEDTYADLKAQYEELEEGTAELKKKLEEKNKALEEAEKNVASLQRNLSSTAELLNQKEVEVETLKEEIQKYRQKEESSIQAEGEQRDSTEKKEEGIVMFSWGEHSHEAVKDDEDGWGWIGAEARLEEAHKHSEAVQIQGLSARVQELEEQLQASAEELGSTKVKCGKLMKKLKEMKNQQSKVGFSDLDFALQEELRGQLDQLEAKVKELSSENSVLKLEKENITKRHDVLLTANEHLVEMKERQDIEVQMWQKRSTELKNEIQGLQWALEEMKSEIPVQGEESLTEKLNAVVSENEELQQIICNLKDGRPIGSPDTVAELNLLKEEVTKLKELKNKEKETMEKELSKANEELELLEQQMDSLTRENVELKNRISTQQDVTALARRIEDLQLENRKLQETTSSLQSATVHPHEENNELKSQLEQLKMEKESIASQLEDVLKAQADQQYSKESIREYEEKVSTLSTQIEELKEQLSKKTANDNIEEILKNENVRLQNQIDSLKNYHESEVITHIEKIRALEDKVDQLEGQINGNTLETEEVNRIIREIALKLKVALVSDNRIGKLKEIYVALESALSELSVLEQELSSVREKLAGTCPPGVAKVEVSSEGTPPVFKGFSQIDNDPFAGVSSSAAPATSQLTVENEELKRLNEQYKHDCLKLSNEKAEVEKTLEEMRNEVLRLQEEIRRQSSNFTVQTEELNLVLNRSEDEIQRLRDEVSGLREEMSHMAERQSRDVQDMERGEDHWREKLVEIEENYQNTLLNREQESRELRRVLQEKEQLLANSENEASALLAQLEAVRRGAAHLEERLAGLVRENKELREALDRRKEECEEYRAELEAVRGRLEQVGAGSGAGLRNQLEQAQAQLAEMEAASGAQQHRLSQVFNEMSLLKHNNNELEQAKTYLESLVGQKQNEIESLHTEISLLKQNKIANPEKLSLPEKYEELLRAKDLEIERVSAVLLATQERLVQVQDSKPLDRVVSLESRLDQALYTLHARDLRCEELTQEIMQLLEERDSLQRRLKDLLTENEQLRSNEKPSEQPASSPDKLGELRRGYTKDPVVVQDRETRHTQQMNLYTDTAQDKEDTSVDYGIFNWFFSSPTPPSPQQ